jgi:hypothetical protein
MVPYIDVQQQLYIHQDRDHQTWKYKFHFLYLTHRIQIVSYAFGCYIFLLTPPKYTQLQRTESKILYSVIPFHHIKSIIQTFLLLPIQVILPDRSRDIKLDTRTDISPHIIKSIPHPYSIPSWL